MRTCRYLDKHVAKEDFLNWDVSAELQLPETEDGVAAPTMHFKNIDGIHAVPFAIYADFEAYQHEAIATRGQKASVCGRVDSVDSYAFYVHARLMQRSGFELALGHTVEFVKRVVHIGRDYRKGVKDPHPVTMTDAHCHQFNTASSCYACGNVPNGNGRLAPWMRSIMGVRLSICARPESLPHAIRCIRHAPALHAADEITVGDNKDTEADGTYNVFGVGETINAFFV